MKKIRNRISVAILFTACIPAFSLAQVNARAATDTGGALIRHEFTIQQALDYANKNNVQVKNALLDVLQQKEVNRQATSLAYPHISATGNLTDNLQLQTTLLPGEFVGQPGTLVPITFGTRYITSGSVDLNQILFDGQVFVALQARSTSIEWASKNVEVTQENIKANIYKVYFQLVASRTQIELIDANMDLLKQQQHDAQIMYDNGFAEMLDVNRATVGLANLQTRKDKSLTTIANGYYGLKVLLGMPVNEVLVLTDTLSDDQIRRDALFGASYTYEDRKDYQYLQLSRDFNAYNIRRYKLSKIPTLSLNGSYSKQLQENEFKFGGDWYTASYLGLRINIPIFTGFNTNSKIAAAKLTVQQLDNQLEAMKISINSEVESARNNFATAVSAMDYQKKNMDLAQTIYDQTKKKYEVGTGSSTDLTTAQKDLQEAQTNYVNSLYDAIIAKVDYLKATGKL